MPQVIDMRAHKRRSKIYPEGIIAKRLNLNKSEKKLRTYFCWFIDSNQVLRFELSFFSINFNTCNSFFEKRTFFNYRIFLLILVLDF